MAIFGGAAATWLLSARTQSKVPTIGFLGGGNPSAQSDWTAAFAQRMRELGWVEDRTVAIEYRFAEGRVERYVEIAAELVQLKVDIIVTAGAGALAAKKATSIIPIVFTQVADPVGSGLVTSLARPGGNLTGLSSMSSDLDKSVELLREVVPTVRHLAIFGNGGNPDALLEMAEIQAAAHTLGLEAVTFRIRRAEDIAPVFEALKKGSDAMYVVTDPLTNANRALINSLALGARLPTIYDGREMPTMYDGRGIAVKTGGLMSYGPNIPDLYRRAADIADKILRGTKSGDIPVEQPTKFDLMFNLTTAKAIGVTIPPTLLTLANAVIE
jgi:putative ABC transport system substrate-binding protein